MNNNLDVFDPRALDIMSLLEEGVLIMKFVHDDARIVYVNRKVRKILGYTEEELIGKGTEDLEGWILNDDVSKFGDILYIPNNEPVPIRIVRMKNRTNKLVTLALKSREVYVDDDPYIQILIQDVSDRISFFDGLPFAVVEFAVAQSRAHMMKIKKYAFSEQVDVDNLSSMINWTITYANQDALSSGLVDIGMIGQRQFKHHLKRSEIHSITNTILNLLRGIEVSKTEYEVTNNLGAKLVMDGMLYLTKDSIIITSYCLTARIVLVRKEDLKADRIDFLQKLLEAEKKTSR